MKQLLTEHNFQGSNITLIYIISVISIFFGIYVIISKNPILSVLFLIGLFTTVALYLITIGLHFIGLSYLLVYIGAVSILFLFILMLINVRISELVTDNKNSIPLAVLILLSFNYSVGDIIPENTFAFNMVDNDTFYFTYMYIMNYIIVLFSGDNNIPLSKYISTDSLANTKTES